MTTKYGERRRRKCSLMIAIGLAGSALSMIARDEVSAQQGSPASRARRRRRFDLCKRRVRISPGRRRSSSYDTSIKPIPEAVRCRAPYARLRANPSILRSNLKFDLVPQWTLALRGDLPFTAKDPITTDKSRRRIRLRFGRCGCTAALINTLNARWAVGGGLRIVAPTGSDDLASRKMAGASDHQARALMLPELSKGSFFTALIRYDVRLRW